ncbi:helix-turn-helix transcriptional regulator [Modestobacter marinus]|uniref:Transcriptional regulator n=1 Tax=Modestobacter marinus TaxID=477641 RepID=A0A846LD60_9ACTN|nr:helix-turn-helix transcriptional regulator [Modestobacter marinus]NIH65597.1 transcriptional regulator with XRE-family HTH domain [Modestobacter marinus]GGL65675.1 transcriptional regulator [Modestobacter marinus]
MTENLVGEYLRARREQVRPDDVGITATGSRRVPGLRRDELAMLAGISSEYYTRLEQGRDRHPSAQVLDAVARALGLDAASTSHLHDLADPAPRRRRTSRTERVRPSVAQLLAAWDRTPAFVQGRHLDVLAANPLAVALSPLFHPGTNLLRSVLLDPDAHQLDPAWEATAAQLVAVLRSAAGPDVDDPHLTELVGELSVRSELFRRLWARHDVRRHPGGGVYRVAHPQVGDLELRYDKFTLADAGDQVLVVYQAEPGSRSAEALTLLASLSAVSPTRR